MKLKCPVKFEFSCRFNFTASSSAQSLAFVMQHDRINWWLQYDPSNDVYGSDVCHNSLVVRFHNERGGKANRQMVSNGRQRIFDNQARFIQDYKRNRKRMSKGWRMVL